jgi:small neutral amino acid transporter SnatA (MarC family)
MVTGSAFVILLVFLIMGNFILEFFRIDIEVFPNWMEGGSAIEKKETL